MHKKPLVGLSSRGRNEPSMLNFPNKTLSSRYSERKGKVNSPTAVCTSITQDEKGSMSYFKKIRDGLDVSMNYLSKHKKKRKLSSKVQSSTARSHSKKSIEKARTKRI